MKLMTVVFPVHRKEGVWYVLLGKQAEGKKMPGIRNGFGGKCEGGESLEACAVREVREELNLEIRAECLKNIGYIKKDDWRIDFYTIVFETMEVFPDNAEMVDIRFFDVTKPELFIHEMLPSSEELISELQKSLFSPENFVPFVLDRTGNEALNQATKNIYS